MPKRKARKQGWKIEADIADGICLHQSKYLLPLDKKKKRHFSIMSNLEIKNLKLVRKIK